MLIRCALLIGVLVVCLGVVAAVQMGLNQTCCYVVERSWQVVQSCPPRFDPHWLQDPSACLHHFDTHVVDLNAVAAAVAAEGASPTAAAAGAGAAAAAAAGAAAGPQGMYEDQPR